MSQIPSGLLESYGVNSPPSKVWLKVDDSGKRWRVTIEKFKDCYFFTDGWKEFAQQVDLMSLAWLNFKPGLLPKQTGPRREETGKSSGGVNVTMSSIPNENKEKCSGVGTQLSFTKEITKDYYLKKLYIPSKFILDTGMQYPGEIKLKDSEGRVWPIHLKQIARVPTLASGWSDFVKDNDLMVGSKVSFTWLSGNMLQARIVKERTDNDAVKVTIRVDDSGKKWKVSIEKFKDQYFFTDGWKEFAEQANLKSHNFLKLNLSESKQKGNKKKRSGDVKATSPTPDEDKSENKKKRSCNVETRSSIPNENNGEGSGIQKKLNFCKEIKEHHRRKLGIPIDFARGIGVRNEMVLKLKDGEGKWPIRVLERVRKDKYNDFTMCRGWSDFVKDNKNKLMVGSTISFTWLSGNTVQAEILGVVTDKQSLFSIRDKKRKPLQVPDN